MSDNEWWFDDDYSECYYAWGHVDKLAFADWVGNQEYPHGEAMVEPDDVEHLWARRIDEERFNLVDEPPYGVEIGGPEPITRYQP